MKTKTMISENKPLKTRTVGEKLLNPNVNQYRLSNEQKFFYTDLFNENASSNGNVKREKFLPLLGIFGTKIAQDFSDRMFLVLSKGSQEITLEQYLNYIDTYHYGDVHERCLYTCKLIDTKQKGKIELEDFQSYINLIINTVKKVNNTLTKKDLMSEKDIEYLFYHISQGKSYFTYSDFENIYQEKPELVSWFDYFKNDKEDILLIMHEFIPIMLKIFNDFICIFMNDLFLLLDKEKEINLDLIFQKVLNYSNKLEKLMARFINKVSKFNISNAFYNLNKQNYNKRKLIFGLQNSIFESGLNKNKQNNIDIKNDNIDDFFKEIKKSLYQKDEKEFILENKNVHPKFNNEAKFFAEKFLKRSTAFRNKDFKFLKNNNDNLRDSKESSEKSSFFCNYDEEKNSQNANNNNIINNNIDNNKINLNINKEKNINNGINNLNNNLNQNLDNNFNYNNNLNNNYNYIIYNNNYYNNLNTGLNNNINNNINNSANIIYYNPNSHNYEYPNEYLNPYYGQDNVIYYNNNSHNIYNTIGNYHYYTEKTVGVQSYLNSNIESTIVPITNFYSLQESQKLKQLLFCSRAVIEKAFEINIAFNNCYLWISENYLSKYIVKKLKEERLKEKKKFKKRTTILNIPRKAAPVKKKIIGASEKRNII